MTNLVSNYTDNFAANRDNSLAYIDMLRGLAIVGVLLAHSMIGMSTAELRELPMNLERILWAGRHGVALFFVVSAFTLTRSMYYRFNNECLPIRKYFLRRFFRIAPAYYFILIITFLFGNGVTGYVNPKDVTLSWQDLTAHLFFVNGFFPYYTNDFLGVEWSVSTEVMFYMLLPIIYLWLVKVPTISKKIAKVSLLCLASIAIVLLWLVFSKAKFLHVLGDGFTSPVLDSWRYFFIANHLHEFAVGMTLWFVLNFKACIYSNKSTDRQADRQADRQTGRQADRQTGRLALAALVCAIILVAYTEDAINNYSRILSVGLLFFWGLSSALLIYVLDSLKPAKIGGMRVFTGLGKVSFSLYLVHFPIFLWLTNFTNIWKISGVPELNFFIYLIVAFSLAYLLSLILYFFIEKPGVELGRALIRRFL